MNTPLSQPEKFLDESKSLACVHCGLCLGSCPTYLETGNENDSPRGRIYMMRAFQDGRLPLEKTAVKHIDLCLGCRACEAACPSGVQYGALLESTRDHIESNYRRSPFQQFLRKIAIERIFPNPTLFRWALIPAKITKRLGLESVLPKFAREALSLIPSDCVAQTLPEVSKPAQPSRGRIGFIHGCVMSVLFGDTNASSVKLLNLAGYEVVDPPGQSCCGALFAHGGNLEEARACARRNIAAFEALQLDAIIINAAGCGSTLKEYGHLLHDDPEWVKRAERFSEKVKDLTEWMAAQKLMFPRLFEETVTYHDACHLAHAQRITKQPRDLIRALAGSKFVELPESDVCCGSAGSYNLTEPEMAERLQKRKIENILKTNARIVITSNPGCILQMRAGLAKAGAEHVRVLHIADFLAEALSDQGSSTLIRGPAS